MSNSIFDWPASPKRFVRFTSAKAEDVNDALDDLSAGLDTLSADLARSLKLPVGTADQTLALAAGQRAGLLLGFDPSGNIAGVAGGGRWRGDWSASAVYVISDYFRDPVSKNIYACVEQHTATSIAADLAAQKVRLAIDVAEVESQRILAQQAATAANQSYTLSSQNSLDAAAAASAAEDARDQALTYAQAAGASAGVPTPTANSYLQTNALGVPLWGSAPVDNNKLDKLGGVANKLGFTYLDLGTIAAGGTASIDTAAATVQRVQAGGALTLTFSNLLAGAVSGDFELHCVNFGGKVITWPAGNWIKSDGSYAAAVSNSGVTWQTTGVDRVLVMIDNGAICYKVLR